MLPFSYATRNLTRSPGQLAQTVGGAALVVFLIFAASSFNNGMRRVLEATGDPHNVILLGAGSEESVERSEIPAQTETLATAAIRGIQSRAGISAVSGEVHFMGKILVDQQSKQALLRGITPTAFEVHREARITAGTFPNPGEILVGRLAHRSLGVTPGELTPGKHVDFEGQKLTIAGVFHAPGTVMESELWFVRNDLMTLTQRDSLSCVVIRTNDPEDHANAELFANQRLDLELVAIPEVDYYASLARFYGPIRSMTWLTAIMIGVGAGLGGINILYAAFASRMREIATLQAIGFSRVSIFVSLLQESLLANLLGTLIAACLAAAILDGTTVNFSMGTFKLILSPSVISLGLLTGAALGTLGTIPPAMRCLRAPLPSALRSG